MNKKPKVFGGSGGLREGKGFSEEELKKAGLWSCKGLFRYDRRRKSCHEENVNLLKTIKKGLIDNSSQSSSEISVGLVLQDADKNSLLGTIRDLFERKKVKEGVISVAWAKLSGVKRLKPEIEELGGNLDIYIGLDFGETEKEAIERLLELSTNIYLVHNRSDTQTYHPKVYFFKFEDDAFLTTGSHNLTASGLGMNIEAREQALQFQVAGLRNIPEEVEEFIRRLRESNNSTITKIESKEDLEELIEENEKYFREKTKWTPETTEEKSEREEEKETREFTFNSKTISPPPVPDEVKETGTERKEEEEEKLKERVDESIEKGELVWEKESLPASDAQDVETGTHITGQLRFSQAYFEVNGEVIDQTSYFRENVFGGADWRRRKEDPDMEVADIWFYVKVNGDDLGYHKLQVRHKPEWEAEQRNVTTMLRWGGLIDDIRERNLTGKRFRLYKPERGKEPFFIEIGGNNRNQQDLDNSQE